MKYFIPKEYIKVFQSIYHLSDEWVALNVVPTEHIEIEQRGQGVQQ